MFSIRRSAILLGVNFCDQLLVTEELKVTQKEMASEERQKEVVVGEPQKEEVVA
jgi:hypothetical protein